MLADTIGDHRAALVQLCYKCPLPPTTSALLAAATNISTMEAKQKLHPGLPLLSIIN